MAAGRGSLNLFHDLEGSAPADEIEDGIHSAGAKAGRSAGVNRLWHVVAGSLLPERNVDEDGLTYHVSAWDETPVTAVFAVIAIIAEDKVVAGRNDEFAVPDQAMHPDPPSGVDGGIGILQMGEVIPVSVVWAGDVHRIRL